MTSGINACRKSGIRSKTPVIYIMGDGISERRYFEDLKPTVKGKRIRPVDLCVSGPDKVLSKFTAENFGKCRKMPSLRKKSGGAHRIEPQCNGSLSGAASD